MTLTAFRKGSLQLRSIRVTPTAFDFGELGRQLAGANVMGYRVTLRFQP